MTHGDKTKAKAGKTGSRDSGKKSSSEAAGENGKSSVKAAAGKSGKSAGDKESVTKAGRGGDSV